MSWNNSLYCHYGLETFEMWSYSISVVGIQMKPEIWIRPLANLEHSIIWGGKEEKIVDPELEMGPC